MTELEVEEKMAATALIGCQLVKEKLERAAKAVATHLQPNRTLDEGDQYALRVIQSRIREIDRTFLARYGPADVKQKAMVELSVLSRDVGRLFSLAGRNHAVGRLDCRACSTKASGEVPMPVPLARLCVLCLSGIQHCYVESGEGLEAEYGETWSLWWTWRCDHCRGESKQAIPREDVF